MRKKLGPILLFAVVGGGIWLLTRAVKAKPLGFYMPPKLNIEESGPYNGYYTITFSTRITNEGNTVETHKLTWGSNYLGAFEEEASRIITLAPGESHNWSWTYTEVFDYYRGWFTCQLFGDWDQTAVGVWK